MLDREHVLRRNWTKFVLDWRHLQENHWTHLHSKECDCIIIIITNKIKLMYCTHIRQPQFTDCDGCQQN